MKTKIASIVSIALLLVLAASVALIPTRVALAPTATNTPLAVHRDATNSFLVGGGDCSADRATGDLYVNPDPYCITGQGPTFIQTVVANIVDALTPVACDTSGTPPQFKDYLDGDTDFDIAYLDYLSDLEWYNELTHCDYPAEPKPNDPTPTQTSTPTSTSTPTASPTASPTEPTQTGTPSPTATDVPTEVVNGNGCTDLNSQGNPQCSGTHSNQNSGHQQNATPKQEKTPNPNKKP